MNVDRKPLRVLVGSYKGVQKLRVANELRLQSLEREYGGVMVGGDLEGIVRELRSVEQKLYLRLRKVLKQFPLWTEWMSCVKGCGAVTAAYVIGWLDPDKPSPSHWWRYCGFGVVNGVAERRSRGEKTVYNPKLKTAMWNLTDAFVKRGGGYREALRHFYEEESQKINVGEVVLSERNVGMEYFDGEKWRPVTEKVVREVRSPVPVRLAKAHVYARARRKVAKLFLSHAWTVWRLLEGKPIRPHYAAERYGHLEYIMPVYDREPKPDWWHRLLRWADEKGLSIVDFSVT